MSPEELRVVIREEIAPLLRAGEVGKGVRWFNESQVAEHTGIPVDTLRSWRLHGVAKVLPFSKVGRLVRYNIEDVDAAIEATRVEVTA